MTNEQILKKAIEKARKSNWSNPEYSGFTDLAKSVISFQLVEKLIFSHDFAEAFWGKKELDYSGTLEWQWRLQQMVLSEEPLKYLEKFI